MTEHILTTEGDTERFAASMLMKLSSGRSAATLVALSGELGAGKTTFAKGFAKALGVTQTIQSPTFVLAKFYPVSRAWPGTLIHIDAYRLERPEELSALGWGDIIRDPKNVILLEWPEKVAPLPASPTMTLTFSVRPEGGRTVVVS